MRPAKSPRYRVPELTFISKPPHGWHYLVLQGASSGQSAVRTAGMARSCPRPITHQASTLSAALQGSGDWPRPDRDDCEPLLIHSQMAPVGSLQPRGQPAAAWSETDGSGSQVTPDRDEIRNGIVADPEATRPPSAPAVAQCPLSASSGRCHGQLAAIASGATGDPQWLHTRLHLGCGPTVSAVIAGSP